jgi:NAD(P)-dependent dehydrogenase (short-subunit alcohol dehydrogenase family)
VPSNELIKTPFDHNSTALEVIAGIDLSGKRAIVTGSSAGIGVETARALAAAGAQVTLAVRNTEAGWRTAADIVSTTGNSSVAVEPLELTDSASVQAFAAAWQGPLDILVNNAAAMDLPSLERTARGWEKQFATNHLGHFELALGLHDALAAAGEARIVAVSSSAHLMSPIVFDDIHFQERDYERWLGYGQSKTANVLFSVEASKRWAGDGITANALMPGGIKTKPAQEERPRDWDDWSPAIRQAYLNYQWKTPQQGAATSVLLAVSPLLAGVGGRYFDDCNESEVVVPPATKGVADYAIDPIAAERLWEISMELIRS